jgi:predicted nuclease with TOPRIM domain
MSIPRFRVPDETRLPSHPVGEVVTYDDHAAEMDRVRHLMDKTSRDNMALRSQNTRLQAEVERLRAENLALRGEIDPLHEALAFLRARIPDPDDLRYLLGVLDDLLRDRPEPFDRRDAIARVRDTLEVKHERPRG